MKSKWIFDTDKTNDRISNLLDYYKNVRISACDFQCNKYNECLASQSTNVIKQYSGGTAAVLPFYDIEYQDKEMRILIIGKENGYMKNLEFGTSRDFYENTNNVLNCIGWKRKNNHIKGTLKILQRIFGDTDSEYVYSSFALTNLLRCSFQKKNTFENVSNVHDTMTMRKNCFIHLYNEIRILEPTLIITQGEWATKDYFIYQFEKLFGRKQVLLRNSNKKYGLYQFSNFMLLTTHHPAILGNWEKNLAPDSVWPGIEYLKKLQYLPDIKSSDIEPYLFEVKPKVDEIINKLESNDRLRYTNIEQIKLF